MYYVLFYDVVDDFVARRAPFRASHLNCATEAHKNGKLVLAGALTDPVDRAVLVFKGNSSSVAQQFAESDPYVLNDLVRRWEVREWSVVIGGEEV